MDPLQAGDSNDIVNDDKVVVENDVVDENNFPEEDNLVSDAANDLASKVEEVSPPAEESLATSDFVHVEAPEAVSEPDPASEPQEESGLEGLNLGRANPLVREEPESLVRWRAEQQQRLADKDRQEQEQKEKLREQAKKELKDWYDKYEEQVKKLRESNRASEKGVVSSLNGGAAEDGLEWERVAKMCDFTEKARKPSQKDVSRMRSILLNLKQNPVQRKEK